MKSIITLFILTVLLSCGQFEPSDDHTPSDTGLTTFGLMRADDAPASPNLIFTLPASALTSVGAELHQTYWVFTIHATHNEVDYIQTMQVDHVFGDEDLSDVSELEDENDIWTETGYFIRWWAGSRSFTARISYNVGSVTGTTYSINLSNFSRVDGVDTPTQPPSETPVETPVVVETPNLTPPASPVTYAPSNNHHHRFWHSHAIQVATDVDGDPILKSVNHQHEGWHGGHDVTFDAGTLGDDTHSHTLDGVEFSHEHGTAPREPNEEEHTHNDGMDVAHHNIHSADTEFTIGSGAHNRYTINHSDERGSSNRWEQSLWHWHGPGNNTYHRHNVTAVKR